ncbi:MAG: amidohydrolase [Bacteroidales bacterium]|jgi:predicted amidohydrolase YtcJ|nr:amidohydrolase [Bacteroidales bacterium]
MKNTSLFLSILIVILMSIACTENRKEADLIIYNAKIYTIDKYFSTSQAMAVSKGIILETGTDSDIMRKYNSENMINAGTKPIYPGFIDAHSHFTGYARGLQQASLREAFSFEHVLEIMQQHAANHNTEWLLGRGWDQNKWQDKSFPVHHQLSEIFPDVPVVLIRIDGHAVIVNQEAMNRLGIDDDTLFPEGEAIYHNGKLSGVFLEHSADRFKNAVPPLNQNELITALQEAQKNCFEAGLTSVCDAGLDKNTVLLIDSLQQKGKLKIRIYAMLNPTDENIDYFVKNGVYKTGRLSIRSIKLYADGALGSRGARLLEPYYDAPEQLGIWVDDADVIRKYSEIAYNNGYQMNIHAIGDAAVRRVIDVYSEFLNEKNDLRWRIEHAQVVHPDDFQRLGQYSIIPSIQSTHATSDMYWAGQRLGNERLKYSYAQKMLLNENGWLPNGTDFPIEEIYPIHTFYAAVFRKDHSGYPEDGFQMENALSREEALRSMTIWAAKATFEEKEKGSLEAGKIADFIMTDLDIMQISEKDILNTKILSTWVGGKKVSGKEN